MIYTTLTRKAMQICFDAHKEQKDKTNLPYVFHPFHLAEQMEDEYSCVVALLHDVVEDTHWTLEDLSSFFPKDIIEALTLLTHDPSVEYMDYIKAIKPNPIAKKVKLADLKHNSDLTRLITISEKDIKRNEKYKRAINYLMEDSNESLCL